MCVRLYVYLSALNNSVPNGRILIKFDMRILRTYLKKIQVLLKSDKNRRALYMKTDIHFWSYEGHLESKERFAIKNIYW